MKNLRAENGIFRDAAVTVFFGGTADTADTLRAEFPKLNFCRVRQTHSDICIQSTDTLTEADAHFTAEGSAALLISTADCLPVMIHCEQTARVAAVHAGWRGIENRITEKMLQRLIESGSTQKSFRFWVGPHIQKNSFEVSADVYLQLQAAHPEVPPELFAVQRDEKYYLDLNVLLRSQIERTIGKKAAIWFSEDDTKTNAGYFSYRRDQSPKRNLSFIAKIS